MSVASFLASASDAWVTKRYVYSTSVQPGTNTVRTAMGNVETSWLSPNTWHSLDLAAGTFNDIQISAVSYVRIKGSGSGVTTIISDGLRTDIDPVSGIAYKDMAQADKHGIGGNKTAEYQNLRWEVNDVKYVHHADLNHSADQKMYWSNCILQHSGGPAIGFGLYSGEELHVTDCSFIKTGGQVALPTSAASGLYGHGNTGATYGFRVYVDGCDFTDFGALYVNQLNESNVPEDDDEIRVANCSTNRTDFGIYLNSGSSSYSYTIQIIESCGSLPTFSYNATTRPNALDHYTHFDCYNLTYNGNNLTFGGDDLIE